LISILIPTFGRADKIDEVYDNIKSNTSHQHEIIFITEDRDQASTLKAARKLAYTNNVHEGNYAGAIQSGVNASIYRFIFFGADDLHFHPNWDIEAMYQFSPTVKVVGTNDLHNVHVLAGHHSTHHLVDRQYLNTVGGVVDAGPGSVLYPGYDHNFSDTEFIGTARWRGVFAPCLSSLVEHRHFAFGLAYRDATYDKGYKNFDADARLYESRKHLWGE